MTILLNAQKYVGVSHKALAQLIVTEVASMVAQETKVGVCECSCRLTQPMLYAGVGSLDIFTPLRGSKSSIAAYEDSVHYGLCWTVWASHCGFVGQPLHHDFYDNSAVLGHLSL